MKVIVYIPRESHTYIYFVCPPKRRSGRKPGGARVTNSEMRRSSAITCQYSSAINEDAINNMHS